MKKILLSVALVLVALMAVIAVSCSNENTDYDEGVEEISKIDESKVGKTYLSGDYEYTVQADGSAYITGYNGSESVLIVPEKIDEYSISGIGERAFYKSSVLEVTVPGCVKNIERWAFGIDLQSLSLQDGVETIGLGVINHNLLYLEIPDSVYKINYADDYLKIKDIYDINDGSYERHFDVPFVEEDNGVFYIGKVAVGGDREKIINSGYVMKIKEGTQGVCFCYIDSYDLIVPDSVKYIEHSINYPAKIYGSEGSYAEEYAEEYGITFVVTN